MKKKIVYTLLISFIAANSTFASYSFVDESDFTGDAFFTPPAMQEENNSSEASNSPKKSIPPLKRLRLKLKKKMNERAKAKSELAPTAPMDNLYDAGLETSQYASHEQYDDFDDTVMPDGFEADEEAIIENNKNNHFWHKKSKSEKANADNSNNENIILDCKNIDYDTTNYCIIATGDVKVTFVKQNTVVKADKITYDRLNNTIKAEENVEILKNGHTIYGEYIFVDMNEENALIEQPYTQDSIITIKSQRGYVYGDKIVQEKGSMEVDKAFPINFRTANYGPRMSYFMDQDETKIPENAANIKLKARDIKITEKGDLEVITLKKASVFKGKTKFLKIPSVKIYTNKTHDFAETNAWEIGFLRGLGMYVGPGFVFEIPGGSVLKAMPILNYNHGVGIGGVARYSSASNLTRVAYGTAENKFLVRGKQQLDDHLYLQYVVNDYMQEWFLGRRRAKYGASLVYQKGYISQDFLIKNHPSAFTHRVDLGYYHDIATDSHYERLHSSNIGTTRARYMAQVNQNLFKYENKEKLASASFDFVGQLSAAVYGTGSTQMIGRVGPLLRTQYKNWMQDAGYFQSVYDDNSPIRVYDAYRYGKADFYLRETFRLNKYFALSWFGSLNLSGDSPNGKTFQEDAFYLTFGPEGIKFSLGYDFIRKNSMFLVELMMDAKNSQVEFEKFEIKQDKKAQKKDDDLAEEDNSFKQNKAPVLQHAVVEDVKTMEDVL